MVSPRFYIDARKCPAPKRVEVDVVRYFSWVPSSRDGLGCPGRGGDAEPEESSNHPD